MILVQDPDQAHVMTQCLELATDVVGTGTDLYADQGGWNVGEPLRELRTSGLDAQHFGAALILTCQAEGVLTLIDEKDDNGSRL
jgi:hypothetical protein